MAGTWVYLFRAVSLLAYNIRGWLKGINEIEDLTQGDTDPLKPKDLFAFKIGYNEVEGMSTPLFNGNIAETYWTTHSDNILRKYSYEYDGLNRLTEAYYQKPELINPHTFAYNEYLQYDRNGNIIDLKRNGYLDSDEGYYIIDDLQYLYAPNSNQLETVLDYSNSIDGFKDGQNPDGATKPDYFYDSNGNMIEGWNKGIHKITYNHLNLPTKIEFDKNGVKTIDYLYNALGMKLGKVVTDKTVVPDIYQQTDYLGGFQYIDHTLQFFPTAEGYVSVTDGKFKYVYNYTDHLGNIRLSYSRPELTSPLVIMEESHYYPFGMKHSNYAGEKYEYVRGPGGDGFVILEAVERNKYQYKYNGKEFQDELSLNWYDYGARNYDAAIGRWMNIDPLAETSRRFSPYTYALNNPIRFIDPDGMEADDFRINYIDKDGKAQEFIFDGNSTALPDNQFVRDFVDAYNHNVGNGGGDSMKAIAENDDIMVDVVQGVDSTQENSINGDYNIITWNPELGLETTNNYILSPATVLDHESDHALQGALSPGKKLAASTTADKQYINKEEARVITGSEQKTAYKNGEIPLMGTTRFNHRGIPVPTISPTSNIPKK
ncbi:RHS repeat-associated protein [Flavobacterium arsenatis]|uniref:RHS repeat-associated protein n=1 Tax=Flavobacterium arsenatis TaxID=1484332 RepID=A0ABU1TUW6_9FLAO|nr:RHS repeat-associated core domain-containing protein [Flavobacterium arsenatis]MDR6969674.1 RHS repeat-associated protein [Flavobacterium arsenatis]